ncbi:hypothetical protein AB0G71_00110 [Streptomyces sp. NPDC020403]|uniref:hypothetical protein n=1 Tax=unclassified Streptomyces TaxID=2593676 RepID=UPI0033DE4C1C
MTMPPQPPQNPYGQPPLPQNPYGQQPAQNPYPQQPAYAYPPQPAPGAPGPYYGQPGMPGAPVWPPQPPRRKRTGLVAGIVAGSLVLVAALGFGVYELVDRGADAVFPPATHELVVEKTVLDGEFTLNKDLSDTEGKKIEDMPDPTIRDGRAAVAQYGSEENGMLVLSGMYGQLASPAFVRGKILEGAAQGEGATVVVPPREYTPEGYGITLECQVVQSKEIGLTTNMPMCAWGDGNTAAAVAVLRPQDMDKDATSLDLAKAAEEAAQVRSEIRRPIS